MVQPGSPNYGALFTKWSLTVTVLLSALAMLVLKSEWIKTFVVTYRDDVAVGLAGDATPVTISQPPVGLEENGKPTDEAEANCD